MPRKTRNPGAVGRQGFDIEMVSQSGLDVENSPNTRTSQSLAAIRLSRRFGLHPSTAAAVVEANNAGCFG